MTTPSLNLWRPAAAGVICIGSLLALTDTGLGGTVSIENSTLIATYDETSSAFSLTEKASGSIFLKEGKLDGSTGKAQVEAARDPVFNSGKRLMVRRTGGGIV